ncbi:flagellar protein [Stenotrophomonas pictorum JCM 9942]|uniref:Flagellar hook-associated protein 2 n=1 Tax=Stenotrophomonas pictorum JCM 9942 TaxID=1236960 RepID=A0A0R0AEW4_9GAMM|nr:flagellar filament capping protein FliD [Stenotrophomonas pictorum]KRG39464.1 flagellar protein [Stenotrophomonas pictorum JCM 9942]
MALNTIGSGLDIPTIVAQLVAAERAPTANRINSAGTAATAKLSALGNIKSGLSNLQTALEAFGKSATSPAFKSSVAEGAGFSASIGTGAVAGSYSIEVASLAQAQKLTSGAFAKDAAVGDGTLSIAWGESALNVEIAEGSTLSDIAAAINKAAGGKGVSASVITADGGQHLVLNATDPGTAGALKLSTTGGNGGLSALTWDGNPGNMSNGLKQPQAATDALVRVDGFERTSSSNSITDIIPGVTLSLSKADVGVTKTLTVSQDNAPLKANLQGFVAAYNATMGVLKSSSSYNATSNTASALTGDAMVRGLQQQMRNLVGGNVTQLKALGISISKEGTLSLDAGEFDKAMAANPTAADTLLGEKGSLASSLKTVLKSQLDATHGSLSLRTEGLNKQIKKLESDLDNLDARMEKVSDRYTRQFTAMDTMVAKMQSTSDYLSQQLAALAPKSK